jgi:hypothetical protein
MKRSKRWPGWRCTTCGQRSGCRICSNPQCADSWCDALQLKGGVVFVMDYRQGPNKQAIIETEGEPV